MIKKILNWRTFLWTFVLGSLLAGGMLSYIIDRNNTGERNFGHLLYNKITKNEEPVNLILCHTILQMVIAEKIIELHPKEKFHVALISNSRNERYEYYYNKLKNKAEKTYSFYYLDDDTDKISKYSTLIETKIKGILLPKYKTIFIASIDRQDMRSFISYQSMAEIKTFDDGTINLVKNSPYLNNEPDRTNHLLKPSKSISDLRESSMEHFTIFKNLTNIMEIEQKRREKMGGNNKLKISYIELFGNHIKPSNSIKDTTKILLGTVEQELKETSEKVIREFGIKYTTMHPRQTYRLDNAITLESNLIIEDYLLKEIEKNPHTQYEIYTFFSGAALTMKDFPNVKVFAIKPTSFPNDYWLNPVYELFEKANIPILEFDDK